MNAVIYCGSVGFIFVIICTVVLSSNCVLLSGVVTSSSPGIYMIPPLRQLNAPRPLPQQSPSRPHHTIHSSSATSSDTLTTNVEMSSSSADGNGGSVTTDLKTLSSTTVFSVSQENTSQPIMSTANSSILFMSISDSYVTVPLLQTSKFLTVSSTETQTSDQTLILTTFLLDAYSSAIRFSDSFVMTIITSFDMIASSSNSPLGMETSSTNTAWQSLLPVQPTPTKYPILSPMLSGVFASKILTTAMQESSTLEISPTSSHTLTHSQVSDGNNPSVSVVLSGLYSSSIYSKVSHDLLSSSNQILQQQTTADNFPTISQSNLQWLSGSINTLTTPPIQTQMSLSPLLTDPSSVVSTSMIESNLISTSNFSASKSSSISTPSAFPNHIASLLKRTNQLSVMQPSMTFSHLMQASTVSSPATILQHHISPASVSPPSLSTNPSKFLASATVPVLKPQSCTMMKTYFPTYIEIDESEPVGSVLASMPVTRQSSNVSFSVDIIEPHQLATIMKGYFGIQISASEYSLLLQKPVDVEQLYQLSGKSVPVKDILLQVHCTESDNSSVLTDMMLINMTIWDEDDESPRFINQNDDGSCVIPVYKADASEDYMGELAVEPRQIRAIDGDLFIQHNISYSVMHAEPENYNDYFNVNTLDGTINKTRLMNASDPRKYVIFVQAVEDSPQQKKTVAVLSIQVFAPSDPLEEDQSTVNPTVKLTLKVISALVILGFASGFIVVAHHRWRRKKGQINTKKNEPCEIAREVKLPELAVYRSSVSSIETEPKDYKKMDQLGLPTISSPSQIQVLPALTSINRIPTIFSPSRNQAFPAMSAINRKKRKVIVKKPIDTKLRPTWNAPTPKKKPVIYSPYKTLKKQ